ncbi:NUDIX domain-containing protein [Ruminococcus sp. Marseille-P6503]|uniref:NUDIX hydrolase n=1 Tax=Ruminococcus sp. Marseille-P6503 TaxID=2364796 RepID=UPI000F52CE6E|nr:NUDIX domain-containing protein [Ruminococcus sp. Marseille-P6503]
MPELWDLYDKYKSPLGRTAERGSRLAFGEFHLVADILAVGKEGKILITQRHPNKPYGGKWEITGGSVIAGESASEGAKRELFEETGLEANELDLRGTIIRPQTNSIHELYLFKGDFDESDIVLQESETVDFKLVTPKELYAMAERGEFLEYLYNRIKGVFPDILGESVKG